MCICMYVCMYIYVCVYMCIYMYICMLCKCTIIIVVTNNLFIIHFRLYTLFIFRVQSPLTLLYLSCLLFICYSNIFFLTCIYINDITSFTFLCPDEDTWIGVEMLAIFILFSLKEIFQNWLENTPIQY